MVVITLSGGLRPVSTEHFVISQPSQSCESLQLDAPAANIFHVAYNQTNGASLTSRTSKLVHYSCCVLGVQPSSFILLLNVSCVCSLHHGSHCRSERRSTSVGALPYIQQATLLHFQRVSLISSRTPASLSTTIFPHLAGVVLSLSEHSSYKNCAYNMAPFHTL